MEPTEKRPNSPALCVALVITCLILTVAQTLYAQRVFETREWKQGDPEVLFFQLRKKMYDKCRFGGVFSEKKAH